MSLKPLLPVNQDRLLGPRDFTPIAALQQEIDRRFDGCSRIRGEKKSQREETGKDYHLVERRSGSFSRSVELPAGIDASAITAEMRETRAEARRCEADPGQGRKVDIKPAA
ncbi:Hsp20/alpha crystallin family protein [Bradyrhizobium sp. WD16]|uniref:Hsp20/alpha crystallin family protein n=1 Tax=Bradyrhizobium sp. WD16 TaxID=1521768 RepID=UPI0020A43B29|nr:Hsp20/alpha crystallin family protein [Bradyrhizobium sp. WD16]UTD29801.1 hypothetical protein DB459_25735 [Bradyrhizobium sp. WD16]